MATVTMTRDLFHPEAADLGDEELQRYLGKQSERLQATVDRLREEVREIEDDSTLSREGKRQARAEVVQELRSAYEEAGMLEAMDELRADIERERERFHNTSHRLEIEEEDRERTLAAEREIRDHLRAMRSQENGDLEVRQTLQQAAREDDRLMLRAVEKDPLASRHPIVSEDTLEEVRDEHIRARYGEKVEDVERRERVVDLMEENLRRADEVAREVAGEPLSGGEDGDGQTVLHE